jgi:hypothetical protein
MFPDLYNICNDQYVTVAGAAAMSWTFSFRRWLTPDLIMQKDGLLYLLNQITLSQEKRCPLLEMVQGWQILC